MHAVAKGSVAKLDWIPPSARIIRSMEQVIEWCGKSAAVRMNGGLVSIPQTMADWANGKQIKLL